jgi:hypothetical protein
LTHKQSLPLRLNARYQHVLTTATQGNAFFPVNCLTGRREFDSFFTKGLNELFLLRRFQHGDRTADISLFNQLKKKTIR